MRILMITDFYPPIRGGVEHHVQNLSATLAERGHSVSVVTQWQQGLDKFELARGVRVHRIRGTVQRVGRLFSNPRRTWAPPTPDPQFLWGLRQVVAQERPQIIHGHDWLARSFLPLKTWSGARLVMSLHYYTLPCAKKTMLYNGEACDGPGLVKCLHCAGQHYGTLKGTSVTTGNWVGALAERALVDMYLPVSHATAAISGLVGSGLPFRVLPNFLSDNEGDTADDIAPYLAQLPKGDFLLFVGVLTPYKGVDVLLAAYASLIDPPPLVLIAPTAVPGYTDVPSGVTILSNWPNAAVMAAWRRSSIALAPSVWAEPCATVVLEAMLGGVPVIASSNGGMPDMILDGETGVLVPPGDASALRGAIERLLADPELRARLGTAGRHRVEQFRAHAVVPQFEQLYEEVLDPHKRLGLVAGSE